MILLYKAEQQDPEHGKIHSFGEAVWYSIVTLTTVGYGDSVPVTPWGRFFGILLIIGSLGVTGYIIGNVSSSINNYMEKKKLGLYGTNFSNHIIIFGYDEFANQVIDQIIETDHSVAIVTNKKNDIELIHDRYGDNSRVFAMFADYSHMESLEKVNVKEDKKNLQNKNLVIESLNKEIVLLKKELEKIQSSNISSIQDNNSIIDEIKKLEKIIKLIQDRIKESVK